MRRVGAARPAPPSRPPDPRFPVPPSKLPAHPLPQQRLLGFAVRVRSVGAIINHSCVRGERSLGTRFDTSPSISSILAPHGVPRDTRRRDAGAGAAWRGAARSSLPARYWHHRWSAGVLCVSREEIASPPGHLTGIGTTTACVCSWDYYGIRGVRKWDPSIPNLNGIEICKWGIRVWPR
jgi:hypothetical protein